MNPWICDKWKSIYLNSNCRSGLRLKFDKYVHIEVKIAIKEYCNWLRKIYCFPIRVPVYVKQKEKIKSMAGEMVSATFFGPYDKYVEPYIRVAAGDYNELLKERGKDNALAAILRSITHELTHYFQWLNDFEQTYRSEEWQATYYSGCIIDAYVETKEHLY
jgi:hypothetical protein